MWSSKIIIRRRNIKKITSNIIGGWLTIKIESRILKNWKSIRTRRSTIFIITIIGSKIKIKRRICSIRWIVNSIEDKGLKYYKNIKIQINVKWNWKLRL